MEIILQSFIESNIIPWIGYDRRKNRRIFKTISAKTAQSRSLFRDLSYKTRKIRPYGYKKQCNLVAFILNEARPFEFHRRGCETCSQSKSMFDENHINKPLSQSGIDITCPAPSCNNWTLVINAIRTSLKDYNL